MKFNSPLRYPGGKAFLAKEFERILSGIGLNKPTYVEPYAGGAGAALALLFANKVKKIVINDYDPAIYAFWKAATEKSELFAQRILSTRVTIKEWKKQKEIYSDKHASILERGFAAFFLNRTNRSGIMNANPIGGLDQTGNYKIDARYNKKNLAERIRKIGEYSDRIEVKKEEGIKLTREYLKHANTFIYLDPPYFKQGAMLYLRHYQANNHKKLADLLNANIDQNWVLTYDERNRIKELYEDRPRRRLSFHYRIREPRKAHELMIFSNTTNV